MSGGNSFPSSYLRSNRSKFWSDLRSVWYKNGNKTIPLNYVETNFTDLSLAIWFMDDGDSCGRLSTNSFTQNEVIFLRDLIKNQYNIRMSIYHQTNRPEDYVLAANKGKARKKFFDILSKSEIAIPSCMTYKFRWK